VRGHPTGSVGPTKSRPDPGLPSGEGRLEPREEAGGDDPRHVSGLGGMPRVEWMAGRHHAGMGSRWTPYRAAPTRMAGASTLKGELSLDVRAPVGMPAVMGGSIRSGRGESRTRVLLRGASTRILHSGPPGTGNEKKRPPIPWGTEGRIWLRVWTVNQRRRRDSNPQGRLSPPHFECGALPVRTTPPDLINAGVSSGRPDEPRFALQSRRPTSFRYPPSSGRPD